MALLRKLATAAAATTAAMEPKRALISCKIKPLSLKKIKRREEERRKNKREMTKKLTSCVRQTQHMLCKREGEREEREKRRGRNLQLYLKWAIWYHRVPWRADIEEILQSPIFIIIGKDSLSHKLVIIINGYIESF